MNLGERLPRTDVCESGKQQPRQGCQQRGFIRGADSRGVQSLRAGRSWYRAAAVRVAAAARAVGTQGQEEQRPGLGSKGVTHHWAAAGRALLTGGPAATSFTHPVSRGRGSPCLWLHQWGSIWEPTVTQGVLPPTPQRHAVVGPALVVQLSGWPLTALLSVPGTLIPRAADSSAFPAQCRAALRFSQRSVSIQLAFHAYVCRPAERGCWALCPWHWRQRTPALLRQGAPAKRPPVSRDDLMQRFTKLLNVQGTADMLPFCQVGQLHRGFKSASWTNYITVNWLEAGANGK